MQAIKTRLLPDFIRAWWSTSDKKIVLPNTRGKVTKINLFLQFVIEGAQKLKQKIRKTKGKKESKWKWRSVISLCCHSRARHVDLPSYNRKGTETGQCQPQS